MSTHQTGGGGVGRVAEEQAATFDCLLRRFRLSAGLSQQALAERSGLSVDAIAALERGRRRRPRAFTLRVLTDSLGLDERHRAELLDAAHGPMLSTIPAMAIPPAPFGPLIGRDDERADAAGLLLDEQVRLLTLTGVGGVGKTQLALAIAREVSGAFEGGVCWVALGSLHDPAALPQLVASRLGVRESRGRPLPDSLIEQLADRNVILLLDNCEHLISACAGLADLLLSGTRRTHVLATSRERLRVAGEVVHVVPPLADVSAAQVFVRRARSLRNGFRPDAAEAAAVATICRELDGIPLALELAAAHIGVLSVEQIAADLSETLPSAAHRVGVPRQQTLRSTMDWSYQLLTADEQRVLRRLSVFAGGCTLRAAAAVCAAQPGAVLDLIGSLADKSLVVTRELAGEARYFLLFTIRRYAAEKLRAAGEHDNAGSAQARFVVELAQQAEPRLHGGEQAVWVERLDAEIHNIRVSLGWAAQHDHELGLRLTGTLWRYCYLRGRYSEGRAWLDDALARGGGCAPTYRAKALLGAGALAFLQCDYGLATSRIEAALDLYRATADHRGVAEALQRLGSIARETGEYEQATRLHRESRALWRQLGEHARVAESVNFLGFVAWLTGDLDRAEQLCTEALGTLRGLADSEGIAWALISLGATAGHKGATDLADELLRGSLDLSYESGYREGVAWSLDQRGVIALRARRTEQARELLTESLERHLDLGDLWRAASVYEELAETAVATDPMLAARLLGAAEELRRSTGARRPPIESAAYDDAVSRCRAMLTDTAMASAWAVGRVATAAELLAACRDAADPC